jgi:hypothetical protein
MRNLVMVASLGGALLGASTLAAATYPDGGLTGAEVVQVLQEKGYRAELTTDSGGDPLVQSSADGSSFSIYFYGCEGEPARCDSIQFTAAFDVEGDGMSLADANVWNREHRFGRVYLDDESDPFLEMDVDVEFGFTTEALGSNVETWVTVLPRFKEHIGF